MNERSNGFSITAAILLVTLVAPFETNFSQEQSQLIKPCMAETTPEKKEDTTNPKKKKGQKRPKTKDEKKDRKESKNSNCS